MPKIDSPKLQQELARTDDLNPLLLQAQEAESALQAFRFSHENLCAVQAESADFRGCVFENCRVTGCAFPNAYFADIVFQNCDLSNSDFSRCLFRRVRFENCKAVGTVFSESVFENTEIAGCSFQMANMPSASFKNVFFHDSDFSGGGFQQCKLKAMRLEGCCLIRTEFLHTPLQGVDLTTCEIEEILLSGEELRGAVVTPVQACDLSRYLGLIVR